MKNTSFIILLLCFLLSSFDTFSQSCQANFTYIVKGQDVFITTHSTYTGAPYMDLYALPAMHYSSGIPFDTLTVHFFIKGKYQICLNVHDRDTSICNSTYCDTVDISSAPICQAKIGFFLPTFYSNSYGTTPTTTYKWDMGDGFISTKKEFKHGYAIEGNYNVCLTITDTATGCNSKVCSIYHFSPVNCTATLTPITTHDSMVHFIYDTEPWQFHETSAYWEYGDGQSGSLPFHKYNSTGTYNVCYTATDSTLNCTTQKICTTVTIKGNENCSPYFYPQYIYPASVHFENGFINTLSTKYFWDFGDGTTGEGINITHQYPLPLIYTSNDYNTCLIVHDTISGCSDSICEIITVDNYPIGIHPIPKISSQELGNVNIYPIPFTNGLNVQFTLKNNSPLTFIIYNYLGEKVYEEGMGKQSSGEKNILLHPSGLTNGVYLLQIKTNETQAIKRIIKQ